MNIFIDQAFEIARGAWRFRRAAVISSWSVALLGWLVVLSLPDVYQARARVYVDTSTALRPLLQGITVEQDIDSQLNLVREMLLGRPQLERVAEVADLNLRASTPSQKDAVTTSLRKRISIDAASPGGLERSRNSDSLYTITYQDSDRAKALAVVRTLLNSLVEDTLGGKRSGADTAQKFLRDQIADYEKRLGTAESALAEFKKKNVGLVPGAQGDYFSRLQTELLAIRHAQSALDVTQRRRGELDRQLHGEKAYLAGGASGPVSTGPRIGGQPGATVGGDPGSRVAEAQARLDELLLRFTDKHPEVLAARETLQQLKARQKAELEALRRGDPDAAASSGIAANPVYQTLQLQLRQTDVEIAALQGELADHRRAESELSRLVNTAPEVEAEFARLNRDYDVTKTQYNALLDRLDKAKLSYDAQQTGIVRFEITDPPSADLKPVAPKRLLLLVAVLAAAIGVGIGLAWVLSQLHPVFTTARGLGDLTGLPVLGAVAITMFERHALELRRSRIATGGAALGLLAMFVVVLVFQQPATRVLQHATPFL